MRIFQFLSGIKMTLNLLVIIPFITQILAVNNVRIYYNDNTCTGQITSLSKLRPKLFINQIVTVIDSTTGTCAANSNPLPCEQKNLVSQKLSSEATACLDVPTSLTPFFPTTQLSAGRQISNANYFYYNTFSGTQANTCALTPGGPVTVNAAVADGNCYAQENMGNYLKASCTATSGTIYSCSDSGCLSCTLVTVSTSCTGGMQGYCVLPSQISATGINLSGDVAANTTISTSPTGVSKPNGGSNPASNSGNTSAGVMLSHVLIMLFVVMLF